MNQEVEDIPEARRRFFILKYAMESGNIAKECREFEVPRSSFYRWKKAYEAGGRDGLIYSGGGTQLRSTSDGQWAQGLMVEALGGGELQLGWPEHPEAREYRVIFLDEEGVSVHQTVTTVPSLRVDRGTVQALSGEGNLFAVVEFIRRSGEIQRSAPRVLPAP